MSINLAKFWTKLYWLNPQSLALQVVMKLVRIDWSECRKIFYFVHTYAVFLLFISGFLNIYFILYTSQ